MQAHHELVCHSLIRLLFFFTATTGHSNQFLRSLRTPRLTLPFPWIIGCSAKVRKFNDQQIIATNLLVVGDCARTVSGTMRANCLRLLRNSSTCCSSLGHRCFASAPAAQGAHIVVIMPFAPGCRSMSSTSLLLGFYLRLKASQIKHAILSFVLAVL